MNNEQFPLPNQVPTQGAGSQAQTMMAPMQMAGAPTQTVAGQPVVSGSTQTVEPKRDTAGLVKTVALVIVSLIAVTFVGLFIWMTVQYNDVSEDVGSQIDAAVATAVYEQAVKLEEDFAEREKEPYRTFTGPADYGQLSFKYPKTWSVYVAADASKGGDYQAFFNPIEVETVSKDTINALRLTIMNTAFESVAESYQRAMERQDSGLSMNVITVAGVSANLYTGKIPETDLSGYIVIFKIRDKTAIMQTDSVLFWEDFEKILASVTFNA